jgi:pimeloyl-ACP methyl ester carboxylesterase
MGVATLLAVLLAGAPLAATAVVYAASAGRRGDTGVEPLGGVGATLAFLREWFATMALLLASLIDGRSTGNDPAARRIAILIPERYCAVGGFWYLRRRLRAGGWACVPGIARTMGPHASDMTAALDACTAALPAGAELVVIGHGIGGVVGHHYAQARPALRIRHVITLGAPHQGSRALPYRMFGAAAAPAIPVAAEAAPVEVIAIYSDFDAWLLPVDDAYRPGGFNIAVRGLGHCAMLLSGLVADLIVENLAQVPRT